MDLQPIVDLANEVAKYNPENIEIDVSVFNGAVHLTINEWNTWPVGYKTVFSRYVMCDDHATACVIQNTLIAFIHKRI